MLVRTLKTNEIGQNYLNLTKVEYEALQDLMYDKNIAIKLADKEIAIVIWNKQDYLEEFQLQLDNKKLYEEVKRHPLKGVTQKIRKENRC